MKPAIFFIYTLGCDKNTADDNDLKNSIISSGNKITYDVKKSDFVIVSTCAFIETAVKQTINEIFNISALKKQYGFKLIVYGCFVSRYGKDKLKKLLPEADYFFTGLNDVKDFLKLNKKRLRSFVFPPASFLKISDGCFNNCSFCAIPFIKGPFHSVKKEELIFSARRMIENGVKEINIVSQTSGHYGKDRYKNYGLVNLIKDIEKIKGDFWIRLFYVYPDEITDELINFIKNSPQTVNYIDMPIQHISSGVLKRMNRRYDKKYIYRLLEKIHKEIPGVALRSTFITGFPGETENDFNELKIFLNEKFIRWIGAFKYSKEEGTAAFNFKNQIPVKIKSKRFNSILTLQKKAAEYYNLKDEGRTEKALVIDETRARCYFQAEDIDGVTFINTKGKARFINVKLSYYDEFNLKGEKDVTGKRNN